MMKAVWNSLNPLQKKGQVIRYLAAFLAVCVPTSSQAGGYYRSSCYYSYPVVQKKVVEVIREKIVPVYQFNYVNVPVNALSYYPTTIQSSYSVAVAAEKSVYVPQPFPVAVPVQQVAYQPVYQPAVAVKKELSCDEKLAAFEARMTAVIEKRLTGNFQATSNGYATGTSRMSSSVIVQKCAGCHDAKDNAAKGKGYVFFEDGQRTEWSDSLQKKMLLKIAKGQMPPPPSKLTDQEMSDIIQEIDSIPSQSEAPPYGDGKDNPPRENGNGGRRQ